MLPSTFARALSRTRSGRSPRRGPRPSRLISALLLAVVLGAPFTGVAAAAGVSGPALDAPVTPEAKREIPLEPGTEAVVRADGSCLRLRGAPSLDGERLDCLPEGSRVTVLEGTAEDDQYRWQQVSVSGSLSGWVADEFLEPYVPPAESCQSGVAVSSVRPGISGSLPTGGGVSLVVWGGGTVNGVINTALTDGCRLASIWTNRSGGGLVGYITGAPDFVNEPFFAQYQGGMLPAGVPLILLCGGQVSATTNISSTTSAPTALLGPWGNAPVSDSVPPPEVSAKAWVVVDGASGEVLAGKDEHLPLPPASLTKIVTAVVAMEGAALDQWVLNEGVDYRQMPGSSVMGLVPGDCFLLRDLLYGLMLPSGNDAALAIARHVAGSDAAFLEQMQTLMSRLGLAESSFIDPHGLGGPGHAMSAFDLAMVSRYAMTLPGFEELVAATNWSATGGRDVRMANVNSFIRTYEGADGLKTGYTGAAGRTVVASAKRDGHRVYVVLLNAPDRFEDAEALMDWAFEHHSWPDTQLVAGG